MHALDVGMSHYYAVLRWKFASQAALFVTMFYCFSVVLLAKEPPRSAVRETILETAFHEDPVYAGGFRIDIRIEPSSRPEEAMRIEYSTIDGAVSVKYFQAEVSLNSIWTGEARSESAARKAAMAMHVVRRRVTISPELAESWFAELSTAVRGSTPVLLERSRRIQLDGTKYRIKIHAALSTTVIFVLGSDVDHVSVSDPPLIRWVASVLKDVPSTIRIRKP